MPYLVEQICLKVIHKAQNNAKDSKGTKPWPCAHVTTLFYGNYFFFRKVNIVFDCIIDNQSASVFR